MKSGEAEKQFIPYQSCVECMKRGRIQPTTGKHGACEHQEPPSSNFIEENLKIEKAYPEAYRLARKFHDMYEEVAPKFGYKTRGDTKAFDPESPNGRTMAYVCWHIVQEELEAQEHASRETINDWEERLQIEVLEDYLRCAERLHRAKDQKKEMEKMREHYEKLKAFIKDLLLSQEHALKERIEKMFSETYGDWPVTSDEFAKGYKNAFDKVLKSISPKVEEK